MELSQIIKKLNDSYKSTGELSFDDIRIVWEQCEDAKKMLDMASSLGVDETLLVQIACKCARLVLHLVPEGEDRPRLAIEAAEAWIENPSKANAKAAYTAAKAIYDAPAHADAYTIANAAAHAASYAADAAYTTYSIYTATHAAIAAYYAASTDINAKQKCAKIVREYVPFELLKTAIIFK